MAMSIRLDPETEARLTDLAEKTGHSQEFHVRQALITYLDELEELNWADVVLHNWNQQGRPSRPADDFWSELED